MTEKSKKWIEIGKRVVSAFVKLPCPVCSRGMLEFQIVPWPSEESEVVLTRVCD